VLPFRMVPPFGGREDSADGGGCPTHGVYASGLRTPRNAHSSSSIHMTRVSHGAEETLNPA